MIQVNNSRRIVSVDMLRGLAMVIMALDHVRDYFHVQANTGDPLDLATTTPALFATRWITHFCAPIFVFLSGTSIYLQGLRKTRSELGWFLVKRGAWLIVAEWVIIAFGWTFNPFYNFIPFQVIWAIGISMLIMGLIILAGLSYRWILVLGLLILFGHNLLDIPESRPGFQAGFIWDLLHHGFFIFYPVLGNHNLIIVYPFLPWLGLMMLGYAAGIYFTGEFDVMKRRKILLKLGTGMILLFLLLRIPNLYGDPHPWTSQKNFLYDVFSILKVNKYPPSLLYACITIGPALLLLAWMETWRSAKANTLVVFGRTAFFYYVLHIYLIHFLAMIVYFINGHTMAEAVQGMPSFPFTFVVKGQGFDLPGVYAVWIFVVVLLYPVCKWYDRYKSSHKEKWWLSYI